MKHAHLGFRMIIPRAQSMAHKITFIGSLTVCSKTPQNLLSLNSGLVGQARRRRSRSKNHTHRTRWISPGNTHTHGEYTVSIKERKREEDEESLKGHSRRGEKTTTRG
ncbi:hypothetical protein Dimus_039415 [Dionaea muscipula]